MGDSIQFQLNLHSGGQTEGRQREIEMNKARVLAEDGALTFSSAIPKRASRGLAGWKMTGKSGLRPGCSDWGNIFHPRPRRRIRSSYLASECRLSNMGSTFMLTSLKAWFL